MAVNGMMWHFGLRSQVPGFLRQRGLIRLMVYIPALIIGVLCTAKWCSPDGASPQPIDSFVFSLHSLETQHARKVRVLHF